MERRVLLAISLSFLVLFAYQSFFPPPDPAPGTTPSSSAPASPGQPAAGTPGASGTPASQVAAAPAAAALRADTEEREYVVETTSVRAVFTNRGARLKHWELKQYRELSGAPVDLVPAETGGQPLPFSLLLDAAADTAAANGALYVVESNAPARIDATSSPAAITFAYEAADGLVVRKRFTLQPSGFELTFLADVKRGSTTLNPRIVWGPGLGEEIARTAGSGGFFSGNYVYPAAGFVHLNGSVERFSGAAASSAGVQQGAFRYAGVTDHYFVASTIEAPGNQRVEFAHLPYTPAGEGEVARQFVSFTIGFDQPPGDVRFFVGPKQFDALSAVSPEFTKVIDFGMFAFLAVPLRGALEWVHGFVGNYGWSIIVLTLLINLVMAPLRHKSVVSMRKMQELQPQLKAIQDRYSHLKMTDPARGKMNEEVMALYKSKGANPASGCLPMLLTLPVLFAFYSLQIGRAHV